MCESLHLELSPEKTLITHAQETAKFLGYDITVRTSERMSRTRNGIMQRNHKGKVHLLLNSETVRKALEKHDAVQYIVENGKTVWRSKSRSKLMAMKPHEILERFNSEIRGFYNYYCIANNCSGQCSSFAYIMEYSLCKTLAQKLNTTKSKIKSKYTNNGRFSIAHRAKDGSMKESVLYNQGFARKANGYDVHMPFENPGEVLPAPTLVKRLKSGVCELCGQKSEVLYMHHVRLMSCIDRNTPWGQQMLKRGRKTLAVCKSCMDIINQNNK